MGQMQQQQQQIKPSLPEAKPVIKRGGDRPELATAARPIRTEIRLHQAVYISCEWLPLEKETPMDEDQFRGALEYVCPAGVSMINVDKELRQEDFWINFLTKVTEAEKMRVQTQLASSDISEIENLVLSENLQALKNLVADDYQTMAQKLLDSMIVVTNSPPEDTSFSQVVKSASLAGMGVKVGLSAAGAATGPVLFLYVGAGILTVFLGVGISLWLINLI